MQVTATARTLEAKGQASGQKPHGQIIDPGRLDLSPDMELLQEQANALNPNFQISCILSKYNS